VTAAQTHRAIDAIWHMEAGKIVGAVTRMVRDVGLAEEIAQDALVAAPRAGPNRVSHNPGAWLMADGQAARHRCAAPPGDACREGIEPHREIEPSSRTRPDIDARSTTPSVTTRCASSSFPAAVLATGHA
jgi:predicted RNA polymerase sigma factor